MLEPTASRLDGGFWSTGRHSPRERYLPFAKTFRRHRNGTPARRGAMPWAAKLYLFPIAIQCTI
jgi:hypothetical protein